MSKFGSYEHEVSADDNTNTWLTPPALVKLLGEFDLDPCASTPRPWDLAKLSLTEKEDGLKTPWCGRVFCNPPYGRQIDPWIKKFGEHKRGILLVFARTETEWFQRVYEFADSICFTTGRISFSDVTGYVNLKGKPAASALIAATPFDTEAIIKANLRGALVRPFHLVKKGISISNGIYEGCRTT